jgi:hypothetical protein
MPPFRTSLCCLLLLAAPAVGEAQEPPVEPEQEPKINFVFASQLGSGVYSAGDRSVQVYRIPIPVTLRSEEEHRWGIQLRFPVALGFYDFRTSDIFEGRLPDQVSTITALAGVTLTTRVGDHWVLGPMAEAGYARDFSLDEGSGVYSVGLEAQGVYERGRYMHLVDTRAVWAGQSKAAEGLADDFLRLQTSYEARRRLPWTTERHSFDAGLFVASYVFFDSVALYRFPREITVATVEEVPRSNVTAQWEAGITFGVEPAKVGRIPVPRLGLSYRFGDDVSAIRFVIGSIF